MKILIVVDMQNDFIDGSLGTPEAQAIVSKVKKKIEKCRQDNYSILFTKDTHGEDYLETQEGKNLPVNHCIYDTYGWEITDELEYKESEVICKDTFGFEEWFYVFCHGEFSNMEIEEIELVGVCTDICVVSNALILKAQFPEIKITVDASCCAGTTVENHEAALKVMKSCQINIIEDCSIV